MTRAVEAIIFHIFSCQIVRHGAEDMMFAIEAADCSFANVSQHTAVGLTLTKSMDEEDSI
jgi:hypothetical protein